MPKLHEILAVDKDLELTASKIVEEAVITFTKKADHFLGHQRTLEMFAEERKQEAKGLAEVKEVDTTVPDKLNYVAEHLTNHFDALAQKENTNQLARADVMIDGLVLLTGVPATLLLALENKLAKLRQLYETIPTLSPGIEWKVDQSHALAPNVYKAAKDEIRHKTEKTTKYKVLYEATDKHPAQIEKWTDDIPVGQYVNVRWSGMISAAQKSALMARLDVLLRAIKKARQRANEQELVDVNIGKQIMGFLHNF